MEPTPEMKAQFTSKELENLSISEEAYYADMDSAMDSLRKPNSFMQEQFTPEQLEELSIKEEAYYADQELAKISRSDTKKINSKQTKNSATVSSVKVKTER